MNYKQLATTISAIVRGSYIPFQGVDTAKVLDITQRHLDVSDADILIAISLITN
jgi:hypothetical protein